MSTYITQQVSLGPCVVPYLSFVLKSPCPPILSKESHWDPALGLWNLTGTQHVSHTVYPGTFVVMNCTANNPVLVMLSNDNLVLTLMHHS